LKACYVEPMRIRSSPLGGVSLAATLAAVGALAWAAIAWWAALTPLGELSAANEPVSVERDIRALAGSESGQIRAERTWPALFGEPAPEPREPRAPPQGAEFRYELKGLITSGEIRWAIVAADGADALVQEGETVAGDAMVEKIRPEGVWLRIGDRSELVVFSDEAPVRTTSVEIGPSEGPAEAASQQIQTQSLSPTELRDIILKAEADRIARRATATSPLNDR
jgi:hypothetical protein